MSRFGGGALLPDAHTCFGQLIIAAAPCRQQRDRGCVFRSNASVTARCPGGACATAVVRETNRRQQDGHFGFCQNDDNGAPVYTCTANQTSDPAADAWPAPIPADRSATENVWQLGISRVTLMASNYGAFKLRQDEGGPKWILGASDVAAGAAPSSAEWHGATQFGAGFGYLRQGEVASGATRAEVTLGTYFTAPSANRTREFGVRYARSTVAAADWSMPTPPQSPPGMTRRRLLRFALLTRESADSRQPGRRYLEAGWSTWTTLRRWRCLTWTRSTGRLPTATSSTQYITLTT